MSTVLAAILLIASFDVQGSISLDSGVVTDSPFIIQLLRGGTTAIDCVYTTTGGNFVFREVAAGSYDIRVQHEGFEDAVQHIEVPSMGPVTISVPRRHSARPIDPEPQLGDQYGVTVRQLATPPAAVRHYQKALADLHDGNTERGIEHLQRALTIAPGFAEAAHELSEVFYANERYAEAEAVLTLTIAAAPSEQRLRLVLARVLVREHKYKEALAQVDIYLQSGAPVEDRPKLEKFRAKLSTHAAN